MRLTSAFAAAALLLGLTATSCAGDSGDATPEPSVSAEPSVTALDLTFDDGTTGIAQILATPDGRVTLQVALPEVVADTIDARLSAPRIEGIDLDLAEGDGGVWSAATTLVPARWDLTVEMTRDDGGFLTTTDAVATFDLPTQEQ